jgi:hypothetical protein
MDGKRAKTSRPGSLSRRQVVFLIGGAALADHHSANADCAGVDYDDAWHPALGALEALAATGR